MRSWSNGQHFSSRFGWDKSHSFPAPYIKPYKRVVLFFTSQLFRISNALKHSNSQRLSNHRSWFFKNHRSPRPPIPCRPVVIFSAYSFLLIQMGRFKYLVDSLALIEVFKEKYHIPQEVSLWYCPPKGVAFDWEVGEVVIPMIAFIEGGMTLLMGSITRDYLRNHRLCPHQCAPNLFRILGASDALNQHLGLGLTWLDVVHMHKCHK